jgi:MinD-like ATPase involved in chromosome partitioning or flagellar assembly
VTSVVVAVGNCPWEPKLVAALSHPTSALQVARRCFYLADAVAAVDLVRPDWVVVSPNLTDLSADTSALLKGARVLALATTEDEERHLRSLGFADVHQVEVNALHQVVKAFDVAAPPSTPGAPIALIERPTTVTSSSERSNEKARAASNGSTRRLVIGVYGTAGAPGRSSIAVGVSAEMARAGLKTLLVDADFGAPAVGALLGLNGESNGLLKAARLVERGGLTGTTMEQSAARVGPNLLALGNQSAFGGLTRVAIGGATELISVAQANFECVVIDLGCSVAPVAFDPFGDAGLSGSQLTAQLLGMCTDVLVCGLPSPLGVTRLITALSDLVDLKVSATQRVVLNRCPRGRANALGAETQALVATHVRKTEVVSLPRDERAFWRAEHAGKAVVVASPRSPVSRGIRKLCDSLR